MSLNKDNQNNSNKGDDGDSNYNYPEKNDEDSNSDNDEERQLENEHRAVKLKLFPLSTKTQQLHGCSSQSAVSIAMPSLMPAQSTSSMAKQLDRDFKKAISSTQPRRRNQLLSWNLQQAFYRLFEPRDAPESQRIVRAGDEIIGAKYCNNTIKTCRYSVFAFIPLNLFEQFLRTANIYFLTLVLLQFVTTISPFGPMPKAIALTVVISVTALRQGFDDFLRYRSDKRMNNRIANVITAEEGPSLLKKKSWWKIRVGQIVKLTKNEPVPADMVLLSSSESTGLCYLETAELDGETNLKYRQAIPETQKLGEDLKQFASFNGEVFCEPPNNHLTRFAGRLEWQGQTFTLNNSNVLLRGCTLRNTDWAFGLVIYTGRQTKLMKNAGKTLYKRTQIEKLSNRYFIGLFTLLITLLVTSAISGYLFESGIGRAFKDSYSLWMKIAGVDEITPGLIALFQCLSYWILVQQIMPMMLYVTLEKVQLFLSRFLINGDVEMYHPETDTRAKARTSTLNEELGQIQYIFSDKTGTLTQNVMTFNKCSIAGKDYGQVQATGETNADKFRVDFSTHEPKYWEPSFKFYDQSLLDDVHRGVPEVDDFFMLLALCHTLNAETEADKLTYKAQSPDEAALVTAARNFGFVFKSRTRSTITVEIHGKDVTYQLLNILEFDTSRKRMSVIVVDNQGRRRLLCKGADSTMFALLKEGQKGVIDRTKAHLHDFASSGLRTLCCGARDIDDAEWAVWNEKYQMASKAVEDREERICECSIAIEKNLTLIGATAIEDKLQEGVPETIANLTNAGIKIWVLTGDKQETAVNIGQSCQMIRATTEELVIDAECYPGVEQQLRDALERIERRMSAEKMTVKTASDGMSRADSWKGLQMLMAGRNKKTEFALIINGHSLFHALTKQLEELFLQVACSCQAVICCRVAPLQKGRVVELVRRRRHATTLAIGDGGNDVNMIRTAHVGVGITGNEGTQAALSSDFTIAQFRFLQRLLLVHGRWNYYRMATYFNFFFYKTIAFQLCAFWYGIYCGWSAQTIYDQWFITAFTLVYTSSPLLYFTLFEQDVNEYYSQKFPKLYYPGLKGTYFNMARFSLSIFEGILTSLVAFFMLRFAFSDFNYIDGNSITTSGAAIGMALGTMIVIIVVVRNCIETTYWTFLNIWPICSVIAVILIQYLLAIIVTKKKEYEYYGVGPAVWTSPSFWLTCIASVAICCLPVLFIRAIFNIFKPSLLYRVRLLQQFEGKKPTDYRLVSVNKNGTTINSDCSDCAVRRRSGGSSIKLHSEPLICPHYHNEVL